MVQTPRPYANEEPDERVFIMIIQNATTRLPPKALPDQERQANGIGKYPHLHATNLFMAQRHPMKVGYAVG